MKISFSPPDISEYEVEQATQALRSGWITTGPKTKLFEKKLSEYCGTKHTVCLNSATAALETTLRVLGIGYGDEVITCAYTYTASASVIYHVGAKIVLVDTAPDSYEMDYEKLASAITDKTKAIIPIDIGGVMCDYDKIFDVLAKKSSLFTPSNDIQRNFERPIIIADAAHSLGSTYHGVSSGRVADFTCFSFHAVKNLTTAEGGAVTWLEREGIDSDALYNDYMLYSLHGQNKDALAKVRLGAWEYDIVNLGYKCNMTDIMAGIGLAQLERYEGLLARRREIVRIYDKEILHIGITALRHDDPNRPGNRHLYLARVPGIGKETRNEIIIKMAEREIATNVHYKPLPMHTAYKNLGFDINDYPNAYAQFINEITLPLHTLLTDEDVMYIAESFKEVLKEMDIMPNA